jgi:predicted transcriptional regulator
VERWRSVWKLKRLGYSQRSIGRILKVSLSSVQHYLAKGEPPKPERLIRTTRYVAESKPPKSGCEPQLTHQQSVNSGSATRRTKGNRRSLSRSATVTDISTKRKSG